MSVDNNETALPVVHPDGIGVQYYGMTLRDYFAAKAMQGWIATGHGGGAELIAKECYAMADAMLKMRGE